MKRSGQLKLLSIVGLAVLLSACKFSIGDFKSTWAYRAFQLQQELDADQSLSRATFLYAKETYNSTYYTTPMSYLDPNQQHSIYDQLELGVRAKEFDFHSFLVYNHNTRVWSPAFLFPNPYIEVRPWLIRLWTDLNFTQTAQYSA